MSQFSLLPPELLDTVVSQLPNSDIKSLRLTSSFFHSRVRLRLDRVFISANPRNIEVLRAVADHEVLRKGVTEVIWDDASLMKTLEPSHPDLYVDYSDLDPGSEWDSSGSEPDSDSNSDQGSAKKFCPGWFKFARQGNIELNYHGCPDVDHPVHVLRQKQVDNSMRLHDSWSHYQTLLKQQDAVLTSNADSDALVYALLRFPSLRRITITPAAHGFIFMPLYETPMIRDFPYGFNYPIPRGWPAVNGIDDGAHPEANSWHEGQFATEHEKNRWRGFRIITQVLAREEHRISEVVIDVHGLSTGLNCRIFDKPSEEYDNFVTILKRPGFRRLDLSLLVGAQQHYNWVSYRSGYLRQALGSAEELEHISLHSDVDENVATDSALSDNDIFVPLRTIFPIDKWPRLQHFGLSRFMVNQDDLISILSALPPTLRSVELSFLKFEDGGDYNGLICGMRNTLNWRQRAINERPKLSMGIDHYESLPGRAAWVEKNVEAFVYGDGINPFEGNEISSPWSLSQGKWFTRDEFDPVGEQYCDNEFGEDGTG
ncbi:hypothetical protein G7Z17_g7733 [Cylindrodendrum hubeiense]|uniref:F-box domain-containing protein n=1 Tax=Cylindrodendrum hubeiense TaxID=595255 RepID=A0A9P5H9Y1_9HYPO|nr:hypothetical protein G7Z17_g7733 [Cylindrodendrum hubeiense]